MSENTPNEPYVPGIKEVYQLDENGVYVGIAYADESPLEPGVWHIPGGCVEEPPPEIPEGKVAVWSEGAWSLHDAPNEETPVEEPTLQDLIALRIRAIDAKRDQILAAGFHDPVTEKTYQCRPSDIAIWTAMAASAGLNILRGSPYNSAEYHPICADNTQITLTCNEASALFEGRVMPWVTSIYECARSKKDACLLAEDETALDAVSIEDGWPANDDPVG